MILGFIKICFMSQHRDCFVLFLVGLEFELRASHLQIRHSTTLANPPVHFALVILEMESHELFA
jgi:hypothetical protein